MKRDGGGSGEEGVRNILCLVRLASALTVKGVHTMGREVEVSEEGSGEMQQCQNRHGFDRISAIVVRVVWRAREAHRFFE